MDAIAQIGPSIRIKGEVTSQEPLIVAGHIDGTIQVSGHSLTVAAGARITATINADTVIIAGQVRGKVQGASRIVVRDTGNIEGDLSAPAIGVADGVGVFWDPGHGRLMKEWIAVGPRAPDRIDLAREARRFVGERAG